VSDRADDGPLGLTFLLLLLLLLPAKVPLLSSGSRAVSLPPDRALSIVSIIRCDDMM
jgi:hypothetical protein